MKWRRSEHHSVPRAMKRSIITLQDMNESLFRNFRILESPAYESVMFATSLKLFRTICLAAERVVDL